MSTDDISVYLMQTFPGLNVVDAWGEKSFFYNPEGLLKRGIYFCTIKEKDGANDKASNLTRTNFFRVNFGISKETFVGLFHTVPKRPAQGGVIIGSYDFTALDILTPHPVYGWMAWVSILNPSQDSLSSLQDLLVESYQLACKKYHKKKKRNVTG
jgi:hypothetical protein